MEEEGGEKLRPEEYHRKYMLCLKEYTTDCRKTQMGNLLRNHNLI